MRLKQLRKEQNLNQVKMSEKIGIPRTNYNKYELGIAFPPIDILIKIADYFNVSLDYLCERSFNNNVGYIPEDKKEGVKKLLQLSPSDYYQTLGYITGLLEKSNKT